MGLLTEHHGERRLFTQQNNVSAKRKQGPRYRTQRGGSDEPAGSFTQHPVHCTGPGGHASCPGVLPPQRRRSGPGFLPSCRQGPRSGTDLALDPQPPGVRQAAVAPRRRRSNCRRTRIWSGDTEIQVSPDHLRVLRPFARRQTIASRESGSAQRRQDTGRPGHSLPAHGS